ncbi:MerR family transcriptional regulator [Fictibacillus macauensis ZFHKF-1]|uniref:MerR family transcriptional regulator n=1 Tax=Fictibacillus macauensis ZFHKF-1 TaxID=1196324 RepID=I8UI39_9BACL|nr:MerR family transcriptional regulator [Fictibacillus macauensis]EIT86478.1 MerR family transcriptional regulator [Fictibacillus macauensis ZFHKF-1]
MEYTIQQLSKIAGVTTRTLRYYDEIQLLKPLRLNKAGHRMYGEKEVNRLQHILFYRELELPLHTIQLILSDSDFHELNALQEHYAQLLQKKERMQSLLQTLEKTMASHEGRLMMSAQEKFAGFKTEQLLKNEELYGEELKERYGEAAVLAANAKFQTLNQEEYSVAQEIEKEMIHLLKKAMDSGDAKGKLAEQAAALHKEWLCYYWPSYSKKAHAGLAHLYKEDERFSAYYNQKQSGMTSFLVDAILHYTKK